MRWLRPDSGLPQGLRQAGLPEATLRRLQVRHDGVRLAAQPCQQYIRKALVLQQNQGAEVSAMEALTSGEVAGGQSVGLAIL